MNDNDEVTEYTEYISPRTTLEILELLFVVLTLLTQPVFSSLIQLTTKCLLLLNDRAYISCFVRCLVFPPRSMAILANIDGHGHIRVLAQTVLVGIFSYIIIRIQH